MLVIHYPEEEWATIYSRISRSWQWSRIVILLPEGKGSVLSRCIPAVHNFVSVSFTTVIRGCLYTSVYCDCWDFTLPVPFPIRGRTSHLLFPTSSTNLKNKSEKYRNQCFISISNTFLIPILLLVPIPSAGISQHCLSTELSSAEHLNCCDQAATWPNYRRYKEWQCFCELMESWLLWQF